MADKTWFDYFANGVALVTGAYTFYKSALERASVSIVPGDRMGIVLGPGGAKRIHVRCVLLNDAVKLGTLQHLEAKITCPDHSVKRFVWNKLFEFVPGTTDTRPAGTPLPITVSGKDSRPLMAQLELVNPNARSNWTAGYHRVEILGWVNREGRMMSANAKCLFHVKIAEGLAVILTAGQPDYQYEDVEIEEWKD